jgi:hypothetical protein
MGMYSYRIVFPHLVVDELKRYTVLICCKIGNRFRFQYTFRLFFTSTGVLTTLDEMWLFSQAGISWPALAGKSEKTAMPVSSVKYAPGNFLHN